MLEETTDGFAIAEQDLRLRKAGELAGTAQAGDAGTIGNIVDDFALYMRAKEAADAIVAGDPELRDPEHRAAADAARRERVGPRAAGDGVTERPIGIGFDFDHTLGVDNGLELRRAVRIRGGARPAARRARRRAARRDRDGAGGFSRRAG